ncbi:MAG: hypothetical protein V7744_20620 [Pseudomonadales bacterium]
MSKNQFRWILFAWLLLSVFSVAFEYIWPNPIANQAYEYVLEQETEWTEREFSTLSLLAGVAIVSAIVSYVGLLLFKSWARHLFVFSLLLTLCLYPWVGVTVFDIYSLVLSELSTLLTGVILMLVYYSPVAAFYEHDT